ncbi:hypothetical protein HN51_009327, partial [Arachis hypogaea]
YYLNSQIHYSFGFKVAYELKKQFYACMKRMTGNQDIITKMDVQLEDFKTRKDFFGSKVAHNAISTKISAQLWDSYGNQHPKRQQFVICVLNLTCSSHKKDLKAKTMKYVVFVMTNSKLAKK